MNKYKTLAANTALISIGTFGSKLLVFFMVRFYTGYLTPSDYGTADLLTQTANLLIPLISLGITDGVFRFAIDRKGARANVFSTGLFVITAGAALFLVIIPLLRLVPDLTGYAQLLVLFVMASCYHALCAHFIRASGNTALFALQGLINTALVIGLNILFLAVFRLGITGYILSTAVANLLCTAFLVIKEKLWRQITFRPGRGIAREMLKYSIPLIPAAIFWWIMGVSDRYMVNAFLGSEPNGIYAVAYKIPTIITIIANVFMNAWQLSAVSESHGDRREHLRFYSRVWAAFQAAMFLCATGIIAFSKFEITLLSTESYHTAWQYIPMLSLAMICAAFSDFMGSVYIVTKKSTASFWTSMVGAAVNIALNLLLIPSLLGVQGAAIATFASCFAVFIIRTVSTRKLIPFRLHGGRLFVNFVLILIQTAFILFELPAWKAVQASAILLVCVFNAQPLLISAETLTGKRLIKHGKHELM